MQPLGYALIAAMLTVAGYFGSYYAFVERYSLNELLTIGGVPLIDPPLPTEVRYRFGGRSAEWFFSFAHEFDRHIRPEYWGVVKR